MKSITHTEIDELLRELKNKRVAIVTHVNPDGDGLSTAIALYFCLKKVYKANPFIIMDSEFPTFLDFLPYKQCRIMSYDYYRANNEEDFDLLVVLDCHEDIRIDTNVEIFSITKNVLIIDHHVKKSQFLTTKYKHQNLYYHIDSNAVSTGVIINRFLYKQVKEINESWKKDYATFIYTTILNDTDNFINSNVDKETFLVVSDLIELGLKPHIITNQFLYRNSIYYYKFIGEVLSTIEVRGNVAVFYATHEMLNRNHQTVDSFAKMMRWTKGTYDVEMQVLFQQYGENEFRVGLRSEVHDVAKIAQNFSGGGHQRAAGFTIKGELNESINIVLSYIESVTS